MRLTKLDMARVIVTALYNRPALVAEDHPEAVRRAKRGKVENLKHEHKLAMAAIYSKMDKGGVCPKCGDDSLPERATGSANALCDDCLGDHLDRTDE